MKACAVIRPSLSRGIALLEVLLCSFILATGILAVLNMQALALGTAQTSAHLMRAEWLLNDILERMKANPTGFSAALESGAGGGLLGRCETLNGCTAAQLATHDLAQWQQRLTEWLPGGHGEIQPANWADFPSSATLYHVQVRWHGNDAGRGDAPVPRSSAMVAL
ncbi:MAG: type IV pilus modification protein PilV [Gammaproteobacteria bacterium]|nr:type IV pilus modification protein PilV [Gammaproteobacteria bacterium]|tara:strand:- start:3351 stop:3845 length:495 start_codon:yes stop_codon:yes gene_type:complete